MAGHVKRWDMTMVLLRASEGAQNSLSQEPSTQMLGQVGAFPSSLDRCEPSHKILLPSNNSDYICRAPAWGGAAGVRVQGLWVMVPRTVRRPGLGAHHTRGTLGAGVEEAGGGDVLLGLVGAERLMSAFASL